MRLLVVGGGQISRALARRPEVLALRRPEVDMERPDTMRAALETHTSDVVVGVGAYTAVDDAEHDPEMAMRVNAAGPAALARLCAAADIPLIHLSTDYVFDGSKQGAYLETDSPAPQTAYGRSKLEGERGVAAAGGNYVILRTAWVFAEDGRNFVQSMLHLAGTRRRIAVVDDQRGCPTYAEHVADGVLAVARGLRRDGPSGLFHMCAPDACTWKTFAEAIFAGAAARGGPSASVAPISSAQYPSAARRPANSVLDCSLLAERFGVRLPPWREGLAACLDRLAKTGWPEVAARGAAAAPDGQA